MKEYHSLSHTRWDCKYHVVFIPKRRKQIVFGSLRKYLGEILHELASHKESKIVEGHLMPDHVHMCISIPPKYAVSNVVGYIKGKSAIQIARRFGSRQRNFTGENFWTRGHFLIYQSFHQDLAPSSNVLSKKSLSGKFLFRTRLASSRKSYIPSASYASIMIYRASSVAGVRGYSFTAN